VQFEKQKAEMIKRLQSRGIHDAAVLRALKVVPREKFVPIAFIHQVYEEKALPIGFGQTISHPYTVARMTELLNIKRADKILEIGTGSGYQCAILCEMGAQVFTVEIDRTLANRARKLLEEHHYYFAMKIGDGNLGWKACAPFDAIIFTAGATNIPDAVVKQLKIHGKLLIPIGRRKTKTLMLYINKGDKLEQIVIDQFTFVELRNEKKI